MTSTRLTVKLPTHVWEDYAARATADGLSIGKYVERLLTAQAGATPSTDAPAEPVPSAELFAEVLAWQASAGLTYPTDHPKKKSALVAWARENGFQKR